jgi:hypothetical protein
MENARQAVLQLMNEYCYRIDAGDLTGFAGLFSNGTFTIIGDPHGGYAGSDAVLAMVRNVVLYDGKPNTKHVMSNIQIDVDHDAMRAQAQCYITLFQAVPPDFPLQPIFIGKYRDEFRYADGRWYFSLREISPDLVGDLSRHRPDMN